MKILAVALSLAFSATAVFADTAQERLAEAATVLGEIMQTPDNGIPDDLLDNARCVVIVPGMKKAAFVVGGEFGRGFVECRNASGRGWGAPAAIRVEGGSVGFQIGGSSTDVVLLVMNQKGMSKLLEDKFTLGADAAVAAGPVGRKAAAATDAKMTAEILSWSRSKGLFAGVALSGATLRPDQDANQELYGKKMNNREVLEGSVPAPPSARALISALEKYSNRQDATGADRVKDK